MTEFNSNQILGFSIPLQASQIPIIKSISPSIGSITGGYTVTITGTNLPIKNTTTTSIKFGTKLAKYNTTKTSNGNKIFIIVPAATIPGKVNMTITTPNGIARTFFTYILPPPTITSITESRGLIGGGYTVTIKGTNLLNSTTIMFGTNNATYNQQNSTNTSLIVTVPAAAISGSVDVTVKTLSGNAKTTFTYILPIPTITSITESRGLIGGGYTVTITGTNLLNSTTIMFGTNNATYNQQNSTNTSLIVTVPAATTIGNVDVVVSTRYGNAKTTFSYVTIDAFYPTITSITPSSGPSNGGYKVTIVGTNLIDIISIEFGNAIVTKCEPFKSGTSLIVTVPEKGNDYQGNPDPNNVDVLVITALDSASIQFTYT